MKTRLHTLTRACALALAAAALFTCATAQATDTITIGSANASNEYLPIRTYNKYSLTQQIYTAAEIGRAGSITSLAFKTTSAACTRTLDIYFVLTPKTSFDSRTDWITVSSSDKVFGGAVTFTTGEWTTIDLATPFAYNAMDNLAIVVVDNTGSYTALRYFASFDATGMALYVYNDQTNFDPENPSAYNGTIANVKNQIQLTMTPPHTVSGLPTANATVTVDGSAVNVPASGEIGVAEGAEVKVTPSAGYRFESFSAIAVEPPPATDLSTLTGDYVAQNGETLTGTLAGNYKISIAAGATVTLKNATINGLYNNTSGYVWAGLTCEGDATLVLSGTNTVGSFYKYLPGVFIPAGKTLTIRGDGSLTASSGGSAAAIGAGRSVSNDRSVDCGNILILGGTITAAGGFESSGIGGGAYSNCGNITIADTVAKVTVTGGQYATYSIGAGYQGTCGTVTIGDAVGPIATSPYTYEPGAATTKDLSTLTGDYVVPDGWTLTGTLDGSTQPYKISIAAGAKVTLRDAVINGVSDNSSCAWPGLSCEGDATITLEGANTVAGFYQASGLFVPASKTLTIRGPGSLDANGTSTGAGIGAYGTSADCGRIVISSGTIKATGGANAAGIGGGWGYYGYNNYKAQCDGIAILGGVVTATAVGYAAGIGGGRYGSCGDITISGGVVTATGHGGGAGIGAGEDGGGCGNIIISGGRVTAIGSTNAAGIGSGWYSKARCGTITISSGITRVAATSPYNPIGQGLAACGTVTIDPSLNDTTEENTRTLTPPPFVATANADGSWSFTVPASDVAVTQVLGLVPEITAVINAIDAIGEVAYTDECKAKIDATRAAYDALTDAQKALVANADTLTAAETTYAALKAAADAAAADAAAAAAVTAAIDAIGDVAYTDESKAKIDAARAAYNALTDDQKALVANYATLTAAEAAYAALVPPPVAPAPCYAVINEADIVSPFAAEKAVTLMGAAYDGCDVAGIVELKLGKVNAQKGTGKVSGSVTTLDGKKHAAKAVGVTGIAGTGPKTVSLEVKGLGTMTVTIGGNQFAGALGGTYHVQSADVGGAWAGGSAVAALEPGDLSVFAGTVLSDFLPTNEVAAVSGGKWKFAKAASVKWAKPKKGAAFPEIYDEASGKGLLVDTAKGANLSGLKLMYTPKKGTFKGSFNVYALEGEGKATKLKKTKLNVSGVVVGGVGYGRATAKKPAVSWPMTVE